MSEDSAQDLINYFLNTDFDDWLVSNQEDPMLPIPTMKREDDLKTPEPNNPSGENSSSFSGYNTGSEDSPPNPNDVIPAPPIQIDTSTSNIVESNRSDNGSTLADGEIPCANQEIVSTHSTPPGVHVSGVQSSNIVQTPDGQRLLRITVNAQHGAELVRSITGQSLESITANASQTTSPRRSVPWGKCNTKAAINARENREKKKAYIAHLEHQLDRSNRKNERLRVQNEILESRLSGLEKQMAAIQNNLNRSGVTELITTLTTAVNEKGGLGESGPTNVVTRRRRRDPSTSLAEEDYESDDSTTSDSSEDGPPCPHRNDHKRRRRNAPEDDR